jgi:hypothetical protein
MWPILWDLRKATPSEQGASLVACRQGRGAAAGFGGGIIRGPLSHLALAQVSQGPLMPLDGASIGVRPLPLAHGTESKQAALKLLLNAKSL